MKRVEPASLLMFNFFCVIALTFGLHTSASANSPATVWLADGTDRSLSHQVGERSSADSRLWGVQYRHSGYLTYGPYMTSLPSGPYTVRFQLVIDNNSYDNAKIATLDVYDSTASRTLSKRDLYRQDFLTAGGPMRFALGFDTVSGHALEFRVYVYGASYVGHLSTDVQAGKLETDMLTWMHSQLPANEYIATHAEHRNCDSNFNCSEWAPVVDVLQPFKSQVNPSLKQVYWRKDVQNTNFYGEIWNYNDQTISIRQESMPASSALGEFSGDPAGVDWEQAGWLVPERFRLFSNQDRQGDDRYPYAQGRVLAPRKFDFNWSYSQVFNTYRCASWSQFQQGTCWKLQDKFLDGPISVQMLDDFSTTFDGVISGTTWAPNDEFKAFDRVVIINQIMNNNAGRERFFFAEREGVYYGIVRWDNSVYDSKRQRWIVVDRTTGLRRATDPAFSFDGMVLRGSYDHFSGAGNLRIASIWPAGKEKIWTQSCADGTAFAGSANIGARRDYTTDVYDVTSFHSYNPLTMNVCVDPSRTSTRLTVPEGCPASMTRGSLYVDFAWAYPNPWVSVASPAVAVTNGWVVLCSPDNRMSFRMGSPTEPNPCLKDGKHLVGSYNGYLNCYDESGKQCDMNSNWHWMSLCSE